MSEWAKTGERLRSGGRRPMARVAPTHERCDGCGMDVTRGTLRNLVKPDAHPIGTDGRGMPYYRLEDYHALCSRCRR